MPGTHEVKGVPWSQSSGMPVSVHKATNVAPQGPSRGAFPRTRPHPLPPEAVLGAFPRTRPHTLPPKAVQGAFSCTRPHTCHADAESKCVSVHKATYVPPGPVDIFPDQAHPAIDRRERNERFQRDQGPDPMPPVVVGSVTEPAVAGPIGLRVATTLAQAPAMTWPLTHV